MRGADVHKTYEATTRDEPRAVLRWGGLGVLVSSLWCEGVRLARPRSSEVQQQWGELAASNPPAADAPFPWKEVGRMHCSA